MCVSTPTVSTPKVEAPVQSVSMDAAESTQAAAVASIVANADANRRGNAGKRGRNG